MSDTEPSSEPTGELPRPNSHRATGAEASVMSRLAAPLGAVAVVVAVVVALILINGHNPTSPDAAALTPGIQPSGIGPTGPVGPSPGSHHHHHHHPGGVTPTTPSVSPSTVTSPPSTGLHSTDAVPVAMAPVQVLNNSRITGLAHSVAAQVEAKGWTVTEVGNLQGRVAVTTIYYAPGQRAAARHLADEFDSVQRLAPASQEGLTAPGLTLVLTRYWSG